MKAEEVFLAALEKATPAQRAAYLEDACRDDAELRAQVEGLLKSHEEAGSFLDQPLLDPAPTLDQPITEKPGAVIGPYKLLQQIGEGGMGVVYMAEQSEPVQRRVALKIIKPGMDTRQVIARFEAERQALAMMDHPNIARVFDAGTTCGAGFQPAPIENAGKMPAPQGRPYFVMELVKGVPITQYCDEHHLTPRERLELFVPVCQAVQHAHQKGIIHRDIKPTNVMVAEYDDRPVPKIIDFGVAKAIEQPLTERTMFTELGQMVGTIDYMSPEQAKLNQLDIDTRSDIYSLGVLLYELLTGETPFDRERLRSAAFDELLRIIREEEPPRPSIRLSSSHSLPSIAANRHTEPKKLSTLVRGELDWIVMKALEKDRARRYETANAFAADVRRYLNEEPVEACPPSAIYKLRKFARKHRTAMTTAAVVAAALLVGTAVATWQAVRATRAETTTRDEQTKAVAERDQKEMARAAAETAQKAEAVQRRRAEEALTRAEASLYFNRINLAYQYWQGNNLSQADRILTECPQSLRNWEFDYLHRLCHAELLTLPGNGQFTRRLRFTKDGKRMAAVASTGIAGVRVWDLTTNKPLTEVSLSSNHSFCTGTISPDGTLLAMGDRGGAITLWDAVTGKRLRLLGQMKGDVSSLDFSPDGKWLAAARTDSKRGSMAFPFLEPSRNEAFKVWSVASGQEVPLDLTGAGVAADFSPDGKRLLAFKRNPALRLTPSTPEYLCILIDTTTWKEERTLGRANSWAFNADGTLLILGGKDDNQQPFLKGIDPVTGKERFTSIPPHDVGDVALSPDGRFLAVADRWGRDVNIWDLKERRVLRKLRGHRDQINAIAFAPDGRLVSCSWDNTIKFWDVTVDQGVRGLPGKGAGVATDAVFSPDGVQVAWVQGDNVSCGLFAKGTLGTVTLWDAERGKITHDMEGHADGARRVAFSADGRVLASGARDSTVRTWDVATGKALATFGGHEGYIEGLAVSPDGRWAASAHEPKEITEARFGKGGFKQIPGAVKVWDARTGQERFALIGHPNTVYRLAFSPDGSLLASYSHGVLKLWDLATGEARRTIQSNTGGDGLVFSPDGTQLLTVSESMTFWDVATGQQRHVLSGHSSGRSGGVAFSRDGRRLLTARGREVKLWDATNAEELLTLPLLEGERPGTGPSVVAVSFSQDGRRILAAMYDGTVQCWDTTP